MKRRGLWGKRGNDSIKATLLALYDRYVYWRFKEVQIVNAQDIMWEKQNRNEKRDILYHIASR